MLYVDMRNNEILLISVMIFLWTLFFPGCAGMQNPERPVPNSPDEGKFVTMKDGADLFVYSYVPDTGMDATIYILSGITGINHNAEGDVIETIAGRNNRVVVIHPRGPAIRLAHEAILKTLTSF